MSDLAPPDSHHLNAAAGWLELGNPAEAEKEWNRIARPLRSHPDSLEIQWRILAGKKDWPAALETARELRRRAPEAPEGWIEQAYALHELKRTEEARDQLLPALDKFPSVGIIPYNLACYACQLGNQTAALLFLERAIRVAGKEEIKPMALRDPDLQPLWNEIQEL